MRLLNDKLRRPGFDKYIPRIQQTVLISQFLNQKNNDNFKHGW